MKNATLVAHCGSTRVDEAVVRAVAQPAFTPSWHPFSHGQVLDAVGIAVQEAGFQVERTEYSLRKDLAMFGVWQVNKKDAEIGCAVGIRNSVNRTLSVGLCAGERVFVCDNLVFSSEFVLFRKHTGLLNAAEMLLMAREAFGTVTGQWEKLRAWHEGLKSVDLTAKQAAFITVAAMRREIITPAQFAEWNELYFGNGNPTKYTPTLHGWHGATTELLNDRRLDRNVRRQAPLNQFIDHEVPLLLSEAAEKRTFSFEGVEKRATDAASNARGAAQVEARTFNQVLRDKVKTARRETKAATKAAAAEVKSHGKAAVPFSEKELEATGLKAIDKALDVKRRTLKQQAVDAKTKAPAKAAADTPLQTAAKANIKTRRTARIKMRERMAASAAPAKGKVGKAPKGDVVRRARRPKAAEGDVYFCSKCEGEFSPADLQKIGEDLLCGRCRAKKS
jgi:DNA-directed RNA polymerase subunit RPC12/RpoP